MSRFIQRHKKPRKSGNGKSCLIPRILQDSLMEVRRKSDAAANQETAAVEDSASQDAGAAAGGGGGYSDTNVRTEGVDEGDIVKTDGSYIYTLNRSGTCGSWLWTAVICLWQSDFPGSFCVTDSIQEMYVDGNTLCVVTSGYDSGLEWQGDDAYMVNSRDFVRLYTYDITDKSKNNPEGHCGAGRHLRFHQESGELCVPLFAVLSGI